MSANDEGYDRQEPHPLAIAGMLVFLVLFLSISGFIIKGYFARVSFEAKQQKVADVPTTEWNDLREASKKRLESYGWVDSKAVHIPIERAMELVIADAKNPPPAAPEKPKAKAKK